MNIVRQNISYMMLILIIFFLVTLSSAASLEDKERVFFTQKDVLDNNCISADKAEDKEVVAVNNATAGNMPYISDAKSLECTKETIKGLKTIGYTLGEIVRNLVKAGNKAQAISMALLSTGDYSGQAIYNALITEGKFSAKEAEAAVPSGIRNEGQLLGPLMKQEDKTKIEQVAEKVRIKNNPLSTSTAFSYGQKESFEAAITRAIDVNSVKPGTAVKISSVESVDDSYNPDKTELQVSGQDKTKGLSAQARVKQELSKKPTNKFRTGAVSSQQQQQITAEMKKEGYTAGEIAQGLYANGVSISEIAAAFKAQGINSEDTYEALMSISIKDSVAQTGTIGETGTTAQTKEERIKEIVVIMNDAGFKIIPAFNLIADDLRSAGVRAVEAKNFLITYIEHKQASFKGRPFIKFWFLGKRTEPAIKTCGEGEIKLAQAMMCAGYSREQISSAFENITGYKSDKTYYGKYSYSKDAISQILNRAAANIVNDGGAPDVKTLSSLLGAEYNVEEIKNMFVAKGISPEETVKAINSSLGELTCSLHDKGKSAAVIARLLLSGNTGDRNNISVVAENLARNGVKRAEIMNGLAPYAKYQTDIVNGITAARNEWKGKAAITLAQGFYDKGHTITQVAAILLEARVPTESAYKALKGLKGDDGTTIDKSEGEISKIIISAGYQKSNVYSAAINDLKKQGINDAKDIVRELVGQIDTNLPKGILLPFLKKNMEKNMQKARNEKMPDAQIVAVCLLERSYSKEGLKDAFISNGFTSEDALKIVSYAAANAQPVKGNKTQEEILKRDI